MQLTCGDLWNWFVFPCRLLTDYKDAISSIGVIVAAAALCVAAFNLRKTKRLNTANAVYVIMKDIRDLQLRFRLETAQSHGNHESSKPAALGRIPAQAQRRQLYLITRIQHTASIFLYKHLGVIDKNTWRPFQTDLYDMVEQPEVDQWLAGRKVPGLPLVDDFDPRFIRYAKKVRRRRRTITRGDAR
jgi:hypothetical protein